MLIQSKERFPLRGLWRGYQTELDFKKDPISGLLMPIDTGFIIKDTMKDGENTLTTTLKAYFMNKIVDETTNDYAMDDLFAVEGRVAGNDGKDGIIEADSVSGDVVQAGDVAQVFLTTLNDGGDNTEVYFELYGYITGAVSLTGILALVKTYNFTGHSADHVLASVAVTETVVANRRYHHYWKVTAS